MKVELLEPHGLCAGVNAAIAKALTLRDVYCLHALVHNEIIIEELRSLGYRFVERIEEVPDGATVVFSAHGVAPSIREYAREHSLKAIDTTCPFVAKVHRAAIGFAQDGVFTLVLGDARHVEVAGIVGELKRLGAPHAVWDGRGECPPLPHQIGVVAQTTLNADEVRRIVEELRRTHEIGPAAEVCTATRDRQRAVREFDGDALLILGSRTSANTQRLGEVARCPVFFAGNMDEVRKAREDMESYEKIGVTAGASTPERLTTQAVKFLQNVPEHVAIIMDGNGRWATARGKTRSEGHVAGAKTLTKVVEWCGARNIRYLSVYAFSTENWKRPAAEVAGLMRLFAAMLKSQARAMVENRVRLRVIGRRGDLSRPLQSAIAALEKRTEAYERQLIVCFSYGGRAEIVDAVNRAIERGEKVTEETFRQHLYAPDVPDPDLIIRTSGEQRTSNFLLWESAYSEYHFTPTLWPDFSEADLDRALEDYASRHRRKGDVK